MAKKVKVPGAGVNIPLDNLSGALGGFAMAVVAFLMATFAGTIAVKLYNIFASKTGDEFQQVDI